MEEQSQNNNKINELAAAIEAVLFVYGEPLEISKIAKIISKQSQFGKITPELVKQALEKFRNDLASGERGLTLISSDTDGGHKIQLATQPKFSKLLEDFIKEEFQENLSPASIETLSLISYLGPLSRAEIDYYRGVNSSFIVRSLLIRGLVNRFQDQKRSNIFIYQPSFDLLKYLGIQKIEDLPEYEKFKSLSQRENQESETVTDQKEF